MENKLLVSIISELWEEGTGEVILKLTLALLCGGLLGMERGLKKRPAGFRTYMLVCLGSTLVVMTNTYMVEVFQTGDPGRMAAQVVSGIGFLGAGTIITTRHNRVTGLTTAAGLWAVASIGLALGIGYYAGAIVGTLLIFFALYVMQITENRIMNSSRHILLYVEFETMVALKNLLAVLKQNNIRMIEFETEAASGEREAALAAIVTVRIPSRKMHGNLSALLYGAEGISYVEEL